MPRHGHTIGQSKVVLRSEPSGEILLNKELEGKRFCIGFNGRIRAYVLGGIFEHGAWLPLGSIQYLYEQRNSFEPSVFDRQGYLAMTTVVSHNGRYIAFVGGRKTAGTLYILDVERDVVTELGSAPAPPPNAPARDICHDEPFEWGTCWHDGYAEMDAGIIRFKSEDVLEVSYGNDSPRARAKKRWVRRFKLGSQ